MLPLTKRQREILDYLNDFIQQHGYAPSLEEIGRQQVQTIATLASKGIGFHHGSDVTLKKLYREQGRIRLQPANPSVQPIYAQPDDVQVRGVVVGVLRRY